MNRIFVRSALLLFVPALVINILLAMVDSTQGHLYEPYYYLIGTFKAWLFGLAGLAAFYLLGEL